MARIAAGLGVVFALVAGGLASRFAEPHHYTVTFTLDKDGVIRADKDPLFEIDYNYGTDWTFVNNTGVAIDVQFLEPPTRPLCHLKFSPASSVSCESNVMPIEPTVPGNRATLSADALDLQPWEYCWSYTTCPGEIRAARHGEVLAPIDPDLQIERDYLLAQIVFGVLSLAMFAVAFAKRRRGKTA
jgi:hypothetical protein